MKIVYAKEFAKQFKKLPVSIQRLYRKQDLSQAGKDLQGELARPET